MTKNVLMVVFHFPPVHGSSGVHRSLNFSRYLPQHGWQPIVLTATTTAYTAIADAERKRIPANLQVERAPALDSARHLSIRGAYPRFLALPDRWISWCPSAVLKGLALIRKHRPKLLWSTYPIATAHLVGLYLHRLSGIPWVADFRDPMTERNPFTGEEFPSDPTVRRAYGWIERRAIAHCARAVFTTEGTAEMYATRYPRVETGRWSVIGNGYDEEGFEAAVSTTDERSCDATKRIVLLHSGTLYANERNPRAFFEALGRLRTAGDISPATLKVVLRASGEEALYRAYLKELRLEEIVHLEDPVPYDEALREMIGADGLLLFQASNCNWQIPAKVYEYLRARRPILALTDVNGDTGRLLRAEGIDTLAPLDSAQEIAHALRSFLVRIRDGSAPLPRPAAVERHSRRLRTEELARLLDTVHAEALSEQPRAEVCP